MNCFFYGKTTENLRNRLQIEVIKTDDDEKLVKMQSKLKFNGINNYYDNYIG